jgi:hypothetical protein
MTWLWILGGVILGGLVLFFAFHKAAAWLLPPRDPLHGEERATRILKELIYSDDWKQAHEFLLNVEGVELRGWYCAALNVGLKEWSDRDYLDTWVGAVGQGSSIPHLFRGINRLYWAWEARGSGLGETVTDERAELFVQRLALAQADFQQALQVDPLDPAPLGWLIAIAKGAGLALAEIATLYARSRQVAPLHVPNAVAMLSALNAKWQGSHEQMFAFARERGGEAPEGHLLHGLIADAHIERWLHYLIDEDEQAAAAYFKGREVREELEIAFERCLGSANPPSNPQAVQIWNDFAFCFWRMDDRIRAKRCFSTLERKHVTEFPWEYVDNNAINAFEEIQRAYGTKVG